MADNDSGGPGSGRESMGTQKALFAIWLAFLVALLALYLVIGIRHG